jgi:putative Ca2+/H+ antiporter (TMEM165/GDT1 family)
VAFFLAEMGDKTQIATVMLAAEYQAWLWVVAGTTLGMMLANAPVVWFGERITQLVPLTWVHRISAAVFVVLGLLVLWGDDADHLQTLVGVAPFVVIPTDDLDEGAV